MNNFKNKIVLILISLLLITGQSCCDVVDNKNVKVNNDFLRQEVDCDEIIESFTDGLATCCTCDFFITISMLADDGSFTINRPGRYCLDTDIIAENLSSQSVGIFITANDVSLDLRGHSVAAGINSPAEQDVAILLTDVSRVNIFNGCIQNTISGITLDDRFSYEDICLKDIEFSNNNRHLSINNTDCFVVENSRFEGGSRITSQAMNFFNIISANIKNCLVTSHDASSVTKPLIEIINCKNVVCDDVHIISNIVTSSSADSAATLFEINQSESVSFANAIIRDNQLGISQQGVAGQVKMFTVKNSSHITIGKTLFENNILVEGIASPILFRVLDSDNKSSSLLVNQCKFMGNSSINTDIIEAGVHNIIAIASAGSCIRRNILKNNILKFLQDNTSSSIESSIIFIPDTAQSGNIVQYNCIINNISGLEGIGSPPIPVSATSPVAIKIRGGVCNVENNVIEGNSADRGIYTGIFVESDGSTITNNCVRNNGENNGNSIGIQVVAGNMVNTNVVSNHSIGIMADPGSGVLGNCVSGALITSSDNFSYQGSFTGAQVTELSDSNTNVGCWANVFVP